MDHKNHPELIEAIKKEIAYQEQVVRELKRTLKIVKAHLAEKKG